MSSKTGKEEDFSWLVPCILNLNMEKYAPDLNSLAKRVAPPPLPPSQDNIHVYSKVEKQAKIARFKRKRQKSSDKKKLIRYPCRQKIAKARIRHGGRFVPKDWNSEVAAQEKKKRQELALEAQEILKKQKETREAERHKCILRDARRTVTQCCNDAELHTHCFWSSILPWWKQVLPTIPQLSTTMSDFEIVDEYIQQLWFWKGVATVHILDSFTSVTMLRDRMISAYSNLLTCIENADYFTFFCNVTLCPFTRFYQSSVSP